MVAQRKPKKARVVAKPVRTPTEDQPTAEDVEDALPIILLPQPMLADNPR